MATEMKRRESSSSANRSLLEGVWEEYKVVLHFPEKLVGSTPVAKELVGGWLQSRVNKSLKGRKDEALSTQIEDALIAEVFKTLPESDAEIEAVREKEEQATLGFQGDAVGLFIRGSYLRAHLKDAFDALSKTVGVGDFKRHQFVDALYVKEYKIYLGKEKHDGAYDQPVHVMTRQGPMNSLKTLMYVTDVTLSFYLKVLRGSKVTQKLIEQMFEYGQVHGLAGERTMGEGRYEVVSIERA